MQDVKLMPTASNSVSAVLSMRGNGLDQEWRDRPVSEEWEGAEKGGTRVKEMVYLHIVSKERAKAVSQWQGG